MQQYNLYALNGYALIERTQYKSFDKKQNSNVQYIDFSTKERRILADVVSKGYTVRILKGIEKHSDNAMFFQIRKSIESLDHLNNIAEEWNEYSLLETMIYLDFSGVFPIERFCVRKYGKNKYDSAQKEDAQRRIQNFFEEGFKILFPGKNEPTHFVPFEKSTSMARKGEMFFIDQRIYAEAEKRLRLGLSYTRQGRDKKEAPNVCASKLYAYTALYLSDAKRIEENERFILNEETVIIIPDNVSNPKKPSAVAGGVITGIGKPVKKTREGKVINDKDSKEMLYDDWSIGIVDSLNIEKNYFDGEGLISPTYMELINQMLRDTYGMIGTAASIQIRMPFAKGMLHSVDFHQFFCEFLGISSCDQVYILDAFGKQRDLGKANIILTQSMFKILKDLLDVKITGHSNETTDLMKLYFERFHKYDHALYIANTDMNMARSRKIKLNYQFLNTLALKDEEQDSIVREHLEFVEKSSSEEYLLEEVDAEDGNGENGEPFDDPNEWSVDNTGETWNTVLQHNPAFLTDAKVQGMLKGKKYYLLKEIGRGRLIVGGANRFLSRDLAALLRFMIGKVDRKESGISEEEIQAAKDKITKNMLWPTKFFVADAIPDNKVFEGKSGKLRLNSTSYYGILRNPHLSRNEQSSLGAFIPRNGDLYSRYFGHLKGVVMVPYASDVPLTLGGADFDGDIVKIVTDKRINRAINSACYEEDQKNRKHVRKLPIISIPSVEVKKTVLEDDIVDFRTLLDTFSSRVGQISNLAISFGKCEYASNLYDQRYDLKCETCTILTGLEIDAAKTGRHPYLEDILKEAEGKDYFVACKDEIDVLPKQHMIQVIGKIKPQDFQTADGRGNKEQWSYLKAVKKYGSGIGDTLMKAVGDCNNRLDRLPFVFLQELLKEEMKKDEQKKREEKPDPDNTEIEPEKKVLFSFEKEPDWRTTLQKEKKEQLEKMIIAYKRIMNISQAVYKTQERFQQSNYSGCINTILKLQRYDESVVEQQETVCGKMAEWLDTYDRAEKVLKQLVEDMRWPFLQTEEERKHYLYGNGILGKDFVLNEEDGGTYIENNVLENTLTNYHYNGYFILYYLIKDIMLYYREALTDLQIAEEEHNKKNTDNSVIYKEFKDIYTAALSDKESKKIWKAKIVASCREKLKAMFNDKAIDALKYVHSLRSKDKNGDFMWDVFTANEILEKSEAFEHA